GAIREAQRDHLWLTEPEWKSLMPALARAGEKFPVPGAIAQRIFSFHLVDSTPGEPFAWSRQEIRSGSLIATVEEAGDSRLKLRFDGTALLGEEMNLLKNGGRAYDAQLLGYLTYDVAKQKVDRFDLVAYGECSGKQAICDAKDPQGRRLLGVAFELARVDSPADRVPPQAARWLEGYLQPGK